MYAKEMCVPIEENPSKLWPARIRSASLPGPGSGSICNDHHYSSKILYGNSLDKSIGQTNPIIFTPFSDKGEGFTPKSLVFGTLVYTRVLSTLEVF